MTLQRTTPGLWADDAWTPDNPGTFALVIGVSEYRHLEGGAEQVNPTYGLGQLAVSALTAFRFFDWLRSGYQFEGAPLVRCWLRLAPTQAERSIGPIDAQDYGAADYAGIRSAVGEWFRAMATLPEEVARQSRAFVFFSGHGLEVAQDQQVLLPSDYLCPPDCLLNDAVSTSNLRNAMRRLALRDQFMFLDACRNGGRQIGPQVLEGNRILNEARPELNVGPGPGLLYATSSGSAAWQQPEPQRGLSMFGEAVLEGLERPRVDDPPPSVWFLDIASYANRRVIELLRAAGSPEDQPVVPFGRDARVCALPAGTANGGTRGPRPASVPAEGHDDVADAVAATAPRGDVQIQPGWPLHACTGSERIEAIWDQNAQLIDLATGDVLGHDQLTPIGGERLDVVRHWFHIAPQLQSPAVLRIWDGQTQHSALLPGVDQARFEIAMHWSWEEQDASGDWMPRLVTMDVDLAPSDDPSLDRAADLWRRYRRLDAGRAADAVTEEDLASAENILRRKAASPQAPLGAVVAGLLLLRADRLDQLHDWLGRLSRLSSDLPDGPALWAEHLSRLGKDAPSGALRAALRDLAGRLHLPFTQDAFGYALSLTTLVVHTMGSDDPDREVLSALRERLVEVSPMVRSGGLFLTLASPKSDTDTEKFALAPT